MKICIIGCGAQGTGLAGLLAQEPDVERLVLADYNIHAAQRAKHLITTEIESKVAHIEAKHVDAGDTDEVAKVAEDADIVMNAIIPRFNIAIMKACLRVKAHYLDLFSSPLELDGVSHDETIDAQLELDDNFKQADITAFPSVGITPGWTSIAAQHIINTMDSVDSVLLRWADWWDSDVFIAPISPYVIFYEWFGPPYPLRIRNNQPQAVDLLESQEEYDFPMPIGKQTIYTVTAHPDIVLIPKFAGKPIGLVEEKGGIIIGPWSMKDLWIRAIREQTAKHPNAEMINMLELFGESLLPPESFKEAYDKGQIRDGAIAVTVEVNGTRIGHPVRHTAYYVSTMRESLKHLPWAAHPVYGTMGGVPLELVLMLGRKEYKRRGVVELAGFDDPQGIFKRLQGRGHHIGETIEQPMGL